MPSRRAEVRGTKSRTAADVRGLARFASSRRPGLQRRSAEPGRCAYQERPAARLIGDTNPLAGLVMAAKGAAGAAGDGRLYRGESCEEAANILAPTDLTVPRHTPPRHSPPRHTPARDPHSGSIRLEKLKLAKVAQCGAAARCGRGPAGVPRRGTAPVYGPAEPPRSAGFFVVASS